MENISYENEDQRKLMVPSYAHIVFNKRAVVFFTLLFIFSLFIIASAINEPLKYLKYTMPVLILAILMALSHKLFINRHMLKGNQRMNYLGGLMIFYSVAFVLNFFKGFTSMRFYQEIYFILSPLLSAFLLFLLMPSENYRKVVYFLFWGITISFVVEKLPDFFDLLRNPSMFLDAFMTSELPTESNFAFQFGMFAIIFMETRKKRYTLFTFFLLLLSFKRIALAGVLVYLLMAGMRRLSGKRLNPAGNKKLILILNCVLVAILFSFFAGAFDEFIEERFGVSSNFITQGRYNIYQDIFAYFGRIDVLGFGLGSINTFLSGKGYELVNLHSDVLKVFFELGPLLFVAWIYCFHKWANTFVSSCLAIYVNILFFTDNVLIYFDVMFVFYMLMLATLQLRENAGTDMTKPKLITLNG